MPTLVTQKSEQKSIEKQVDEIFEIRTITVILALAVIVTDTQQTQKTLTNNIMTTEEQLKEIIERTEITDLLIRYFAAVDDKCMDMKIVKATFTIDAKIIRPDNTAIVGQANILDGHIKSFARFKATHHVITNFVVDINNDMATLRSNIIANHLWADNEDHPYLNNKNFLADGVFSAKAIKIDNHWRISELKNFVIWRTGDGMKEILNFGRSKD